MADAPKFDASMPELMLRHAGPVLDAQPDALVVGPGLGTSDAARSSCCLRALLPSQSRSRWMPTRSICIAKDPGVARGLCSAQRADTRHAASGRSGATC